MVDVPGRIGLFATNRPAGLVAILCWAFVSANGCAPSAAPSPLPTVTTTKSEPPSEDLAEPPHSRPDSVLVVELAASDADPAAARFEIHGLPPKLLDQFEQQPPSAEQWSQFFSVTTVTNTLTDPPSMLGEYRVEPGMIVFEPRFPLRPGMTYRATVNASGFEDFDLPGNFQQTREFVIPKAPPTSPTMVTAIYPSTEILPENLLRLYIHFSAPMSRGDAYRHIHLLHESGETIESPFLELGEELWDPSFTRFTLFFDPGRIKRGLKPRELFGTPLHAGQAYTLVIDHEWLDAEGNPLQADGSKDFLVAARDEKQPHPSGWKLKTPSAGTVDPLVVDLDEPLDHAMLGRMLWITDSATNVVIGKGEVLAEDCGWRFVPDAPWSAGQYSLVVDSVLEDPAGNSIRRPFEVDESRPADDSEQPATSLIPFRID